MQKHLENKLLARFLFNSSLFDITSFYILEIPYIIIFLEILELLQIIRYILISLPLNF